jgi:FMN-dependent oxidoreductase (nitrilotriacetate monooxygenase family)
LCSSFNPAVAANFGNAPLPPRKERYARATEFIDVLKKLWDSWDLGREGPIGPDQFWDSTSAHPIDHNGEFFSVKGPLNVPRSPRGQPVIAQAGASEGGLDLAARHGEIIYCNVLSKQAGFAFGKKVRDRAVAIGRDPREILIVPGVVPVVAESYEAALRRHEAVSGAGSEDGLLKRFVAENGVDPQTFDPDAVLDAERFLPDQNRMMAVGMGMGLYDLLTVEKLTARQVVRRTEGFHRLVLGTPEQVADALIDYWRDGAVDGYTVQPPIVPEDLETFVDKVIPVLQDRGVFPREYQGKTIRERYGLNLPASEPRRLAATA